MRGAGGPGPGRSLGGSDRGGASRGGAGLEAFLQDPDPADAPYQRSLAERRADALDDLAHHALTTCDTNDWHDEDNTDHTGDRGDTEDWDTGDDTEDHDDTDDDTDVNEQFTRTQRRAIATRDHHCVFPSCTRPPRWCDTHHLHPRGQGGPSTIDNGALLCRFHHRLVHEHGWTLTIDTTGHWTATDPHGTTWTGRPTPLTTSHDLPRPPHRPTHHNAA